MPAVLDRGGPRFALLFNLQCIVGAAKCDEWQSAVVHTGKICGKVIAQYEGDRKDAEQACNADAMCSGLTWNRGRGEGGVYGGPWSDGRVAVKGWYQTCSTSAGMATNEGWDVIVKPTACKTTDALSPTVAPKGEPFLFQKG